MLDLTELSRLRQEDSQAYDEAIDSLNQIHTLSQVKTALDRAFRMFSMSPQLKSNLEAVEIYAYILYRRFP